MPDTLLSLNIGRPVAWMVSPTDDSQILGVTYLFSLTRDQITVWYTETGEPAQDYRLVQSWDQILGAAPVVPLD